MGDGVFPVLTYGLALKDRLVAGERLNFVNEQTVLRGLLSNVGQNPAPANPGDSLGNRYGLVSWLDEIFIIGSPWNQLWQANSLEWFYFSSNERAHKFWAQAKLAEASGDTDTLEVFYLCVMLGFRGDLRDRPDDLRQWRKNTETQIFQRQREPYRDPPAGEPTPNADPLKGQEAWHRLSFFIWAFILGILIPALTFIFVLRLKT